MLFEKINLEKLNIEELTILFQSLIVYNQDEEKNHDQIDNFLDRVSDEIQSKERKIALQVDEMFRGSKWFMKK